MTGQNLSLIWSNTLIGPPKPPPKLQSKKSSSNTSAPNTHPPSSLSTPTSRISVDRRKTSDSNDSGSERDSGSEHEVRRGIADPIPDDTTEDEEDESKRMGMVLMNTSKISNVLYFMILEHESIFVVDPKIIFPDDGISGISKTGKELGFKFTIPPTNIEKWRGEKVFFENIVEPGYCYTGAVVGLNGQIWDHTIDIQLHPSEINKMLSMFRLEQAEGTIIQLGGIDFRLNRLLSGSLHGIETQIQEFPPIEVHITSTRSAVILGFYSIIADGSVVTVVNPGTVLDFFAQHLRELGF